MRVTRGDVLRFRVHAQQLDRPGAHDDAGVLDLGVQDTGHEGAAWALELRGAAPDPGALLLSWTVRGAPHVYRRAEAAQVAAAVGPWSDADAAKRIFDAARPLKAAGIPALEALDRVAAEMRDVVTAPTPKGEMSSALTRRLPEPYLRWCNPCGATHVHEQSFRLAALRAGLELEPGTSPPVLRRIPGWRGPARTAPRHLDPVRGVLRLLGPSSPRLVAGYLDAPVREVTARWPDDVAEVEVHPPHDGRAERLQVLAEDADALADPPRARGLRLLGAFDLFLQGRDRELVLPDADARKDLWRTLGRPGGVLLGHEVVGSWRPRSKGGRLRLAVTCYDGGDLPPGLADQAERLAAFRGQVFDGLVDDGAAGGGRSR